MRLGRPLAVGREVEARLLPPLIGFVAKRLGILVAGGDWIGKVPGADMEYPVGWGAEKGHPPGKLAAPEAALPRVPRPVSPKKPSTFPSRGRLIFVLVDITSVSVPQKD